MIYDLKQIIVLIATNLIFLLTQPCFAQIEVWGVSGTGGDNSNGFIYRINPTTGDASVQLNFPATIAGRRAYTSALVEGPNGNFYGTTRIGGKYNEGVLFEWNPITNQYMRRYDFSAVSGSLPEGSLVFANGKFYGMTTRGGANDSGTIFEWDPDSNDFQKKIDFKTDTRGRYPRGTMVYHNEKFYGMTSSGGLNGKGVIFQWDPVTNEYIKKIDLSTPLGAIPNGSLTYLNGKFFGVTSKGGSNNAGVIFEWEPETNIYTKKIDLTTTNGAEPWGKLAFYNGKFYGMASKGGANNMGSIFEWDPVTNIFTKRINLSNTLGSSPFGKLTLWNGNFYGMTFKGGSSGQGIIFEWNPQSNVYTKKVDFNGKLNGSKPRGSLIVKDGTFYGMTYLGGTYGDGVIFQWELTENSFTKKIEFGQSEGHFPIDSPTVYNGKFYGMTSRGGANGLGVIYEWDPATGKYVNKIDFSSERGGYPNGSLYLLNGKFYGTTSIGGAFGKGVLFEWDPASNEYLRKVDFETTKGANPDGTIHFLNGKFFGLTYWGGEYGSGVIYEYDIATNVYHKRFNFDGIYGNDGHRGFLTMGSGKFYGMARAGGDNDTGYIFQWDPQTDQFRKGASLPADFNPGKTGPPIYYNYTLYGITEKGGEFDQGMIYTASLNSGIVNHFSLQSSPKNSYITEHNGNIYGLYSNNQVFEFDLTGYGLKNIGATPPGTSYAFGKFLFLPSNIFFEPIESKSYGDEAIILNAIATSGLPVRFSSSDESIAKVEGNKLKIKDVGSVTILAEELGDPSFATPVTRTFTVTKAPLTVAAVDTFKVYGGNNPSLRVEYSGFVNADNPSGIDIPPVISTTTNPTDKVGEYEIIVDGGSDNHYDFMYKTGKLSILPAPLTVVAKHQEKKYGEPIPQLTYMLEGFKYNDDTTDITLPVISTEATAESDVGVYPIYLSGGKALNYDFILVNSTLSILKASAEILFSKLEQTEDGTPKTPVITTSPANLEVDLTFNNSSTLPISSGTYEIFAKITDKNYEGEAYGTFVISTVTGITSNSDNGIKLYPNPATDFLLIEDTARTTTNSKIFIYNNYGHCIFKGTFKNKIHVDLDTFSSGLYHLKIQRDDISIYKRFVVAN